MMMQALVLALLCAVCGSSDVRDQRIEFTSVSDSLTVTSYKWQALCGFCGEKVDWSFFDTAAEARLSFKEQAAERVADECQRYLEGPCSGCTAEQVAAMVRVRQLAVRRLLSGQ